MSFEALAWAAKVRTKHSTDKLVLLGLAEVASRDAAEAWPSIASLCEFGSLNRKTVIAALDRLIASGFIAETGEQKGRTGQVKVYRLNLSNSPEIGTVKQSQNRDRSQKRNSSDFTRKQSQKRDTEPMREPIPLVSSNDDTPPKSENDNSEKPLTVDEVVEAWNETAGSIGLRRCAKLTEDRRKRLRSLIRKYPIEDFQTALAAVRRSSFCRGENERGWSADIEFFSRERNFVKLIEGSYDGKQAA